MKAHQPTRPATGRGIRLRRAGAFLFAAAVLGACTGENLFTGLGRGTDLVGPSVEITAPQPDQSIAVGDSVQVSATLMGSDALTQVSFTGDFQAGGVAFVAEVLTLNNPTDTTVSNFLVQDEGGGTGDVSIIVEATDVLGARGADTVVVSITN